MGEATFYFKAKFESSKAAKDALPIIQKYLVQQFEAGEFWQSHRDNIADGGKEMLMTIRERWPMTEESLRGITKLDASANELAGQFIDASESKPYIGGASDEVRYSEYVWHFDNWDHLKRFAEKIPGCIQAAWISDEYIDPWETF